MTEIDDFGILYDNTEINPNRRRTRGFLKKQNNPDPEPETRKPVPQTMKEEYDAPRKIKLSIERMNVNKIFADIMSTCSHDPELTEIVRNIVSSGAKALVRLLSLPLLD